MSNNSKQSNGSLVDQAALVAASGGSGGGAQDLLAAILVEKFAKEKAEQDKETAQVRAFKEAQLAAVEKTIQDKLNLQRQCPHLKPNHKSAVGGQKDHSGHYHFICQYCQKEWVDGELPYQLQIPGDTVGGPQ
jgi:hypothetical protein